MPAPLAGPCDSRRKVRLPGTRVGTATDCEFPTSSPQHQASPAAVSAPALFQPADREINRWVPLTGTDRRLDSRVPVPSWPLPLSPQQYALPSAVSPQA